MGFSSVTPSQRTFQDLARRYDAEARAFIRRRLGKRLRSRVDTGDVLQESLIVALKRFGELGDLGSLRGDGFFAWFRAIIENRIRGLHQSAVAEKRDVRRERRLESAVELRGASETPSKQALRAETAGKILAAIGRLPPRQREVVRLVYLEKLSVAEAAARMGKSSGSTSVLLHRGLLQLRQSLGRLQGSEEG